MIKIYTIAEVANILRVNRTSVYKLLKEKKLKYITVGSKKVTEESLIKYIKECEKNE